MDRHRGDLIVLRAHALTSPASHIYSDMALLLVGVIAATLAPGAQAAAATAGCSLSNVFGSSMVLQRAPQAATVWGFAPAGTIVKTTFASAVLHATADAAGV